MKRLWKRNGYWVRLLFCMDLVYIFITWLLRPSAFKSVGTFILIFSLIMMVIAILLEQRRQREIAAALENFLDTPCEETKAELLNTAGMEWGNSIGRLYDKLASQFAEINEMKTELASYREFVEAWVHEIKTPLSLSTLLLNNRKDEMSPVVYSRMNYVQRQLTDNVERILYYARLNTDHADYKFSKIRLDICVQETVDEYVTLANENHIVIHLDLKPVIVSSDRKVLHFMVSQLLSNACKYANKENGQVSILNWQENDKIHLAVRNNGYGIPPEDAPFIFDKGFTGNHPDRQKATGMGLYLVRKYADALCIDVSLEPISISGTGFGIELVLTL